MSIGTRVRGLLVESPGSLGARTRARRWELTCRLFPDLERYHVVDLGGTVDAWLRAPVRPRHVTVINLTEPGVSDVDWIEPITGDACDGVQLLGRRAGRAGCDMVYSNAVLEHVGGHAKRLEFAQAARQLASRHWIQTPYRYFPLEPHWLFPGMQHLPVAARARIARHWGLAHTPSASMDAARTAVLGTELLSITELREYFPSSRIVGERVGGLIKSIIAVRT